VNGSNKGLLPYGKRALWISEIKEITKPYYRSRKSNCGSIKKTFYNETIHQKDSFYWVNYLSADAILLACPKFRLRTGFINPYF